MKRSRLVGLAISAVMVAPALSLAASGPVRSERACALAPTGGLFRTTQARSVAPGWSRSIGTPRASSPGRYSANGDARVLGPAWQVVAPLPQDLFGAASASAGGYMYVFGGYSFSTAQTLDTVYRYDPVANSWTTLAPMPQGALTASAVYSYPNKIYVFGGADRDHARPAQRDVLRPRLRQVRRPHPPERGLRHGLHRQRPGDDLGVRPVVEYIRRGAAESSGPWRLRFGDQRLDPQERPRPVRRRRSHISTRHDPRHRLALLPREVAAAAEHADGEERSG
jgi:hypothetical protein